MFDDRFGKRMFDDRFGKRMFDDRFGKRMMDEDRFGKRSDMFDDRFGKRMFDDRFGKRMMDEDRFGKRMMDEDRFGKRRKRSISINDQDEEATNLDQKPSSESQPVVYYLLNKRKLDELLRVGKRSSR